MKTKPIKPLFTVPAGFAAWLWTSALCLPAFAQGSAFTYQGRLNDGANPANATYDFRFTLFDAFTFGNQVGSPLTNLSVNVSNGLFAITLDFGAGVFTGPARWLEIGVRTNGSVTFTNLNPRQSLKPAPYAIHAATAGTGGGSPWSLNGNNTYYNAGNVGIGTSTPVHRLSLSGGPTWTGNAWAGAVELANGAAIGWQANPGGQRFGMGHSYGGFYLFRTASDPGTTGSPALYDFVVDDSGNVGIGTVSPTPGIRLEVNGSALLTPGGSGGSIQFDSPNAESGMTIIGTARADLRFDGTTVKLVAGPLGGPPASTSGIVIKTNGNVGIGTISPSYKLDVEGNARFTGRILVNNSKSGGVTLGLQTRFGDTFPFVVEDSSGNSVFDLASQAGFNYLTMFGDAQKTSGGTSWLIYSDLRLKQDVRPFESGLNEVLQLRPVRFRYRADAKRGLTPSHQEVGFIAQEVREVIPDAVTEGQDGYLTLKADPIHWAAINAIQELNAKLEEQRAENSQLKQRLEALEKIISRQKPN